MMKRVNEKVNILLFSVLAALFLSACSLRTKQEIPLTDDHKLILYTSHKAGVYEPIVREFEERTGIWVQTYSGGTMEMMKKMTDNGSALPCDVMFGGGVESYEAYKNNFQPYVSTQDAFVRNKNKSPENLWTCFSKLPIVIVYNNKLVNAEDAPKGWADLMKPEWKGKIAYADINRSGTSYTAAVTMMQALGMGQKEYIRSFMDALNGKVVPESGDVVDQVIAGTRLVGVTIEEDALKRQSSGGKDITIVYPMEGTSAVEDGCAIAKNALHTDNARKFADFIVSRDMQKYLVDSLFRRSVRTDVAEWHVNFKEIDIDLSQAGANQQQFVAEWNTVQQQVDQE